MNPLSWLQDKLYNSMYGEQEKKRQATQRAADQQAAAHRQLSTGKISRPQYSESIRSAAAPIRVVTPKRSQSQLETGVRAFGRFATKANEATLGNAWKAFDQLVIKPTVDVTDSVGKAYGDAFGGGMDAKLRASNQAWKDLEIAKRSGNRALFDRTLQESNRVTNDAARYNIDALSNVDPVKQAANTVNLGLTAATAGGTGTILKQGISNTLGKKVVRGIAETAPLGAAFGATQAFQTNGQNTTAKDIAINAALGAGTAAALGAAGPLLAKGAGRLAHLPREIRENAVKTASEKSGTKTVSLDKLTSYEGAPDRARVDYYKQQIQAGKDVGPIYVMKDKSGKLGIEDGKHRYQAMRELGYKVGKVKEVNEQDIKNILSGGYVRLPGGKDALEVSSPSGRMTSETIDTSTSSPDASANPSPNDLNGSPESPIIVKQQYSKQSADNQLRPTTPETVRSQKEMEALRQSKIAELQAEARRRVDELKRQNGRFIQSADDLPQNALGGVKRKVQIANKQADAQIQKVVRSEADRLQYEGGALTLDTPYTKPVREAVREMGGVASSDWESLPRSVKNKNGRALDDMVGEMNERYGYNFANGDELAQALIDDVGRTEKGMSRRSALGEATATVQGSAPIKDINDKRVTAITDAVEAASKINVKTPRSKTHEYIAVESGDGAIQLKPMDDAHFKREDGVIVDKDGKSVGTYVSVDGGDITAYVGGKPMNITAITGDPNAWGRMNKVTHSMTRLLEQNAPNKQAFERTYDFLVNKKMQSEAVMKTELATIRKDLRSLESDLTSNIPNGIKKKELAKDIMRYGERKTSLDEIAAKYGSEYAKKIEDFDKWARTVYDGLLDRANKVLVQYGKDPIPRRNNYYTHYIEPGFWEKVGLGIQDLGVFGKSISGDVNPQGIRNNLPVEIAGQTDQFKPITKWNPFSQKRRGSYTTQDAFGAIDAYLEPIMFNIHMTEPAARARVIEKTFRAADKIRTETLDELNKELELAKNVGAGAENQVKDKIDAINAVKPRNTGNIGNAQFVEAIQEYANALAGKTNRLDRQLNSFGAAGKTIMKTGGAMQRIAGANSIPGNLSSAAAQVLSLPQTFAMNGAKGTMAGVAQAMRRIGHNSVDDPIRKSAFMRARYTDAESLRRGKIRNYTDKASIPLEIVERAFGEINWYSNYHTLKKQGISGDELIKRTDMMTEKTLSGRGIGDRPEAFRSTALNTVLQFGLEVNNSRIQFFREMTPKQKAYFVTGAFAMNWVLNQATGNKYLPDYIDATWDEGGKWLAQDDDKNAIDKTVGTAQRFAGETAKFFPGSGTVARMALGEDAAEAVFGRGSDMTRFDESPITKVPKAIATAAGGVGKFLNENPDDTVQGLKDVRSGILGVVPTGAGIKKMIEGGETFAQGQYTDKNGKSLVEIDQNPINGLRSLMFGKYATPEVNQYFDNIGKPKSQQTPQAQSSDPSDPQQLIYPGTDKDTKLKASAERVIEARFKFPANLSKESRATLEKYARLSQEGRSQFNKDPNNKYARLVAELERDAHNGALSEAQLAKKTRDVKRFGIEKEFDDDTRAVYGMSKTDAYAFLQEASNGSKIAEKLIAMDKALFEAGITKYRKYANGIAPAQRSSGRRGSSSGGRGRKLSYTSFKSPYDILTKHSTKGAELARTAKLTRN